jgi:chromosome partitioning protein
VAVSIACISGKGGVGKTTTCASLAAVFAERGRRVLAVDMDPQSNLTSGLGFNPYSLTHTVADAILEPEQSVDELIVRTKWAGLHLLPANPDLSAVEARLPTTLDSETRLRRALAIVATTTSSSSTHRRAFRSTPSACWRPPTSS